MTEGERIVREWWPKYKENHWQARLAEQINKAIDAAVAKSKVQEPK